MRVQMCREVSPETTKIRDFLLKNSYPAHIIDKAINSTKDLIPKELKLCVVYRFRCALAAVPAISARLPDTFARA